MAEPVIKDIEIIPIEAAVSSLNFQALDADQMLKNYRELTERYKTASNEGAYGVIHQAFQNPTETKLKEALIARDLRFFKLRELITLVRLFGVSRSGILFNEMNYKSGMPFVAENAFEGKTFQESIAEIQNFFEGFENSSDKLGYIVYMICLIDYASTLSINEH